MKGMYKPNQTVAPEERDDVDNQRDYDIVPRSAAEGGKEHNYQRYDSEEEGHQGKDSSHELVSRVLVLTEPSPFAPGFPIGNNALVKHLAQEGPAIAL